MSRVAIATTQGTGKITCRGTGTITVVGSNGTTLGTLSNPATSAVQLYDAGITTSDWQYIQTSSMGSPRQVWCNMDDQGGGWMLMAYTPYFSGTGLDGLRYPNIWENGEGTLDRLCVNAMDLWFHNGNNQCSQILKMASTTESLTPILTNMSIANRVVYNNPDNLDLNVSLTNANTTGNFGSFTNNTKFTGTWYPVKGHTAMSSSLTIDAPGDWIYSTSGVWWTVCGPSSALTTDGRSGNAQGTGSWTNQGTSNLYGMADVAATTNSGRTDLNTYAVFIK